MTNSPESKLRRGSRARFWDTSAIIQVYHGLAKDHRKALGLWSGPRSKGVEQITSALVAIEAVRRIHIVSPECAADLRIALKRMWRVPVDDQVLPIGYALAQRRGEASGADRAIVACAMWIARQIHTQIEFVTSDASQAEMAGEHAAEELEVIQLNPGL